ncbi:type VI secretion system Vgr family protein [Lysobacter enzymogenes]|uniref:Type VI secretion system Vgr family protein n=1 Tax=Lysobacter enzymogenes TaxID=69 RepID=A0A0S2DJ59_LYSEN|nr:type VI secretion system tip protein TssI/VgrG [Lysobacter enzymogenes]ALN58677.1 type VI secretion system Vgr family protein [Lysobacter enzymogenes]QCW26997.1 type VI secretion system tip protein VgrG [Lysobacter enzymogenes]
MPDSTMVQAEERRILRLRFPRQDGPASDLLIEHLDAFEGVSQDFRFDLRLLSKDARIAAKDVIGKMVTVELDRGGGSVRHFNGYVFEFRRARADGGWSRYDMVLLPWLAFLRLRKDNYLFHDKSVYDSTVEIFEDYAARDFEARLSGASDPPITQGMQWDESDYNYLHRRWESRGWHYWYEHRADGHRLVLSDDSMQSQPIEGVSKVRFHDGGGSLDEDAVADWSPYRRMMPTAFAATSFDFKNPAKPGNAATTTVNRQGDVPALEIYEYGGAYGFKNSADGDTLAQRRMEEIEAQGKRFDAIGNCRRIQPGRWFQLEEHFEHDQDDEEDRRFLILEARHSASNNHLQTRAPAHYTNEFAAVRKKVPWRPGRNLNSDEPKIYGILTAVVVGPSGEEIECDEFGRVRVQFHFDREGGYDEKASCWVRVASNWAGDRFGFMAVPRIGQEVLVQFLGGNPDMPIIVGRVFNQDNMPPWDLPANKTQTGILTRSSSSGGYDNANAIRFEDKKGDEQLWIHAEKNQDIEVEHDETHWVGQDRRKTIDRDETVQVKRDRTETVDRNETVTVHGQRTETVDQDETITIHQNRKERVDQNESVSIGGNRSVTIDGNKSETVMQAKAETIALAKALTIGLGYQTTVGAAMNTTVGLSQSEQVGIDQSTRVGQDKSTKVGKKYFIDAGDELEIVVGKSRLVMKKNGDIALTGVNLTVDASEDQKFTAKGNIKHKGRKVLEN